MDATAQPTNQTPAYLAIASGAVLAIASFLSWVTVKASVPSLGINESFSASGWDGSDGKITLICGLLIAAAGVMYLMKAATPLVHGILAGLAGVAALIVGLIDYSDATDAADVPASVSAVGGKVEGSASFGLYLVILAAVVGIVAAVMLVRNRNAYGAPTAPDVPPAAPPAA